MHAESSPPSDVAPAFFIVLFFVLAALLFAAIGFAGWIVVRYWGQISV